MSTARNTIAVTTDYRLHEGPRAYRVGMISTPTFNLNGQTSASSSQPQLSSPPLPVRSPLRPIGRSISSNSAMTETTTTKSHRSRRPATPPALDIGDFASIVEEPLPLTFQMRHQSYPSGMEDSHAVESKNPPMLPESPISTEDENSSSSSSSMAPPQTPMTKRQHALHELLSSERAYASDLALIREFHIPMALGQQVPLNIPIPSSPPSLSSSSSSRTVSTASDCSAGLLNPPMTFEDVRIIFSNIGDLAQFSDHFCNLIEEALGSTLDGGEGEDRLGALFIAIIPEMEKPYKYYINRHPTALNHLQSLPSTPALTEYMQRTHTVASNLSHAWDIASLLIKPVQRLLKYSLLLGAIIDETPDSHGDKENLKLARQKMEEVARNVNEGRRRAEVVKEVLAAKKRPVNVGVAAQVNLTRMKSLSRHKPTDGEAAQVERLHAELKRIDAFAQQFAKSVVDWAKAMNNMVFALRTWAIGFGKVIGLSPEAKSEAFEAFMAVVEEHLVPLCRQLESDVNDRLLREIAHLLTTMNQPIKLLASMEEQEPFHYHLLTMNVSPKNRPPPQLLAASSNYLALRGQLAAELPTYLSLLHHGLAQFVLRLAQIQASFWVDVRDRWAELWDMLRVEGEMNAGHEETVAVWQARWADVNEVTAALNITQAKKLFQEPLPKYDTLAVISPMSANFEPQVLPKQKQKVSGVVNALAALEPAHASQRVVSAPQPLVPRARSRGASVSEASISPPLMPKAPKRNETAPVSPPSSAKPTRRKGDALMEFVAALPSPRGKSPGREQFVVQQQQHPSLPRTKSMPLSSQERSTSHPDASRPAGEEEPVVDEDRGRTSRTTSIRRKFTDSLRPGGHYRRRSASKTAQVFVEDPDAPPPPSVQPRPQQRSHTSTNRDSWFTKPAKYVCCVIHECRPPVPVSYFSFPFFTLIE
ncbi:Rho guanine nucleotide exchange factor gef1, partial [Termitomyces sp. T112]